MSTAALPAACCAQDLVDLPLPPWLKDQRYLVPLLAAYDGHIAALEERVAGGGQQLGQLAERTQALASENESLRDELQATLVAMERQAHTEPLQVSRAGQAGRQWWWWEHWCIMGCRCAVASCGS